MNNVCDSFICQKKDSYRWTYKYDFMADHSFKVSKFYRCGLVTCQVQPTHLLYKCAIRSTPVTDTGVVIWKSIRYLDDETPKTHAQCTVPHCRDDPTPTITCTTAPQCLGTIQYPPHLHHSTTMSLYDPTQSTLSPQHHNVLERSKTQHTFTTAPECLVTNQTHITHEPQHRNALGRSNTHHTCTTMPSDDPTPTTHAPQQNNVLGQSNTLYHMYHNAFRRSNTYYHMDNNALGRSNTHYTTWIATPLFYPTCPLPHGPQRLGTICLWMI